MPEGKIWRTLVLLEPNQEPGTIWQFAQDVARANDGEPVAIVVVPQGATENELLHSRKTLAEALATTSDDVQAHVLLVETHDFHRTLNRIIEQADIDLVLTEASPNWTGLDRLSCAVGVLRGGNYRTLTDGDTPDGTEVAGDPSQPRSIERILVPTSAGPNSAHALSFILPLSSHTRITALYVAPSHLGSSEEALGRARLDQILNFIDADDRIERKLIQAPSITEGIVNEARAGYELVLLGASRESPFDRALFGDVVGSVVRQSKTPVIVVREPRDPLGVIGRDVSWRMRHLLPRLSIQERAQVYVRVRRGARPSADFFILIALSSAIAALGLLLSSPAVVIGAMLVAPLMSPMVGVGMAMVLGDTRFLRLSVGAVVRGVLLGILVGALAGLLRHDVPLTPEILSRTQPTLLDLGVALFAGLAGAYAFTESEAAAALPGVAISAALVPPLASAGITLSTQNFPESLGALLLFTVNFAAIVFASVLVFLARGFRPTPAQKTRQAVRKQTMQLATGMLLGVTLLLGLFTVRLTREAALHNTITSVVETRVEELDAEVESINILDLGDELLPLELEIAARSTHALTFSAVEQLQQNIATDLQPHLPEGKEVQLELTLVRVTRLDPFAPPTPTPTPSPTSTPPSEATPTAGPP